MPYPISARNIEPKPFGATRNIWLRSRLQPPAGFVGGTHAPFMHALPAAQSPFTAQAVRHTSPAASHVNAPHDAGTTIKQLPPPLQVRAGIDIAALQLAAPHTVPLA